MFEETISNNKNCLFPILFIDFNSTIARAHILSWENCVSYLFLDNVFGTQREGIFNGYTILVRIINPSPNTSILFLCKDLYWHPSEPDGCMMPASSFALPPNVKIQIAFDAFCAKSMSWCNAANIEQIHAGFLHATFLFLSFSRQDLLSPFWITWRDILVIWNH